MSKKTVDKILLDFGHAWDNSQTFGVREIIETKTDLRQIIEGKKHKLVSINNAVCCAECRELGICEHNKIIDTILEEFK